jgi:DnaJ-class molecular chaperone
MSNRESYVVLGLDPSGAYTEAEIKAAFRAKALEYHPDTNKTNKAEAEKNFLKLMEAYNALKGSK